MIKKLFKNHNLFLKNIQKYSICYTYHNLPTIDTYYYNNTKINLDDEIDKYSIYIQAFLQKRRVLKYEIPPKINVLKSPKLYEIQFKSQIALNNQIVDLPLNTLSVIFDNAEIDTNYIKNIFLDKNEDSLYDGIMHKVIINGFEPHLEEKNTLLEIRKEIDDYLRLFIKGEELTNLEKVIEIEYLTKKYEKRKMRRQYQLNSENLILTEKDCIKLLCKRDISIDFARLKFDGYKTFQSDIFHKNNVILYIENKHLFNSFFKKNSLYKKFSLFLSKTDKNISLEKTKTLTLLYLINIIFHLDSERFVTFIDTSFDFFINHFVLCMHIWLIIDRFGNFSKNKYALDIKGELWSDFINMTSTQWTNVDTLRKLRKFKNLENQCKQMIEYLTWHFKVQNNTADNHFYKCEALVWQFVFRERIPRYDERVYKLAYYLVNNYHYLQSKSFDDLINFNFAWNIEQIPKNYKEVILKFNPPLSKEEFFKEKSSKYDLKKYHYFYLNEKDREEVNMSRTHVRYNLQERLDKLRTNFLAEPNKDYDEAKDDKLIQQINMEYDLISKSKSNITLLFWKIGIMKNLFNKLDKEDADRKSNKDKFDIIQYLPGKKIIRFSEKHLNNDEIIQKLHKYRSNLVLNKKNALKQNYHIYEERVLISPELNISTKLKKRKPFADRLFNL